MWFSSPIASFLGEKDCLKFIVADVFLPFLPSKTRLIDDAKKCFFFCDFSFSHTHATPKAWAQLIHSRCHSKILSLWHGCSGF